MKSMALFAAVMILSCTAAFGQAQEKVLWSFGSVLNDGLHPMANLVADAAGNLYGTTQQGGSIGPAYGTVFELSPQPGGTWQETILYSFCSVIIDERCFDGELPQAGLILDAEGNLYGTTTAGGTNDCAISYCGTVFELSPPTQRGGPWTEAVLYSFCSVPGGNGGCLDGATPLGQLLFDALGNLYGTASVGGNGVGCCAGGIVFELSPGPTGWTEQVLYNFCSVGGGEVCDDGATPVAGVTLDKLGNLYGTASQGGGSIKANGGIVYELSPSPAGWIESILVNGQKSLDHGFEGGVAFDPLGNLYTTYATGGTNGGGGVLQFNPKAHNLTSFSLNDTLLYDPPIGTPVVDLKRKIVYAIGNGYPEDAGLAFGVDLTGQEITLTNFCTQAPCTNGSYPFAGLIEDKAGNLYGTTKYGGTATTCDGIGCGVVYEITPDPARPK